MATFFRQAHAVRIILSIDYCAKNLYQRHSSCKYCDTNVKCEHFTTFCDHSQAQIDIVNVATAFGEAQILKILLAIDFSSKKPCQRHPSCKYIYFSIFAIRAHIWKWAWHIMGRPRISKFGRPIFPSSNSLEATAKGIRPLPLFAQNLSLETLLTLFSTFYGYFWA